MPAPGRPDAENAVRGNHRGLPLPIPLACGRAKKPTLVSPPCPPLPEGEEGKWASWRHTRSVCARTPRPVPPPRAGARAREWGDSRHQSVCDMYRTIGRSETISYAAKTSMIYAKIVYQNILSGIRDTVLSKSTFLFGQSISYCASIRVTSVDPTHAAVERTNLAPADSSAPHASHP